jgi:hypothetical protein
MLLHRQRVSYLAYSAGLPNLVKRGVGPGRLLSLRSGHPRLASYGDQSTSDRVWPPSQRASSSDRAVLVRLRPDTSAPADALRGSA